MFSSLKCLVSLFDVQVNSFASQKQEAGTHKKLQQKNYPSMNFHPRSSPFCCLCQDHHCQHKISGKGKYFCSHSTSSLPSFIKDNRWWKIISLFPGPTQETLIYLFVACWECQSWILLFRMNPYKVTSLLHQCEDMASVRPQTTAKPRHITITALSSTFWCWWTFLPFGHTPFVLPLVGLGASACAPHSHSWSSSQL